MTTDTAARLIAEARAVLRSKRANLCRHGVARDHCRDCELPDPRAEEARAALTTETEENDRA